MSGELRSRKAGNLMAGRPVQVATANIGCMLHLEKAVKAPVKHWLEILDEAAAVTPSASSRPS
jgi:glycolate oxidase iron-sulfur subunit